MSAADLRARLEEAMDTARRVYQTGHDRYDAGRYEGLKQALELLDSAERGGLNELATTIGGMAKEAQ